MAQQMNISALMLFRAAVSQYLAVLVVCILPLVGSVACTNEGVASTINEVVVENAQVVALEATVRSLEESVDALADENSELAAENTALRERLDSMETVIQESAGSDPNGDIDLTDKEQWMEDDEGWSDSKDNRFSRLEGTVLEQTARLAADAGGVVYYIEHEGRGNRTVLVLPQDFVDGETPLIVSLHGFGGNSADHAAHFPLHERVNSHGLAVLLPTGSRNADGFTFWNPTDECCQVGKSGQDDVGYLTELVAEAEKVRNFGPIIFFGYSNGGFMAHHMACKGLPGLKAVISLAGTSYVDDYSCENSRPIDVLHIHGTEDYVIMFEGDSTESDPDGQGEPGLYIGAEEIVTRWSHRAGCAWPEELEPYETLDLDEWVQGAETQLNSVGSLCGVGIELWKGVGSGHSPGYGDDFMDAVGQWILSRFDSPFDDRCPGYDPRTREGYVNQPHIPVVVRADLVEEIAEAIRQDLKDSRTIDNLEIEDAGEATEVWVYANEALGDPLTGPNRRIDGTPFFRVILLWAEAHFEDRTSRFFRVYANFVESEEGCVVSGVAIPPLDFIP